MIVTRALSWARHRDRPDNLFAHEGDPVAARLCPRTSVFLWPATVWLAWTALIDVAGSLLSGVLFSTSTIHGLLGPPERFWEADWPGLLGEFVVLPLLVGYYFWAPTALIGALRRLEQDGVLTIEGVDVGHWQRIFRPAAYIVAPLAVLFGYAVMNSYVPLRGTLWLAEPRLSVLKLFASWIPLSYMTIMLLYRLCGLFILLSRLFGAGRAIVVRPLHPDGAGGLEPLSAFSLKLTFFLGLAGTDLIFIERSYYFGNGLAVTESQSPSTS